MIRQPSVRSLSIVPPTQQSQQQLADIVNALTPTNQNQSSSATATNPPPHHLDHRRTLVSGASRRNLLAEMHQNQHSLRSLHSLHHTTSGPVPQPPPVIMNIVQLQTQSNGITYDVQVEITCSINEEHLHIEVKGKDDTSVQAEINIHPIDLTGVTSTKANSTPNGITTNSNNSTPHEDSTSNDNNNSSNNNNNGTSSSSSQNMTIAIPPDNVPYNWTFPTNRVLQNNLGKEIVEGIQLCVRGGQEFSIILPDPTKLTFEVDPQDEEMEDIAQYTGEDATKILQGKFYFISFLFFYDHIVIYHFIYNLI